MDITTLVLAGVLASSVGSAERSLLPALSAPCEVSRVDGRDAAHHENDGVASHDGDITVELGTIPPTGMEQRAFLVTIPAGRMVVFNYQLTEAKQGRNRGYFVEVGEPFYFTWHAQGVWPWMEQYDVGAVAVVSNGTRVRAAKASGARNALEFVLDAQAVWGGAVPRQPEQRDGWIPNVLTRKFCGREFRGPGFWSAKNVGSSTYRVRNTLNVPYETLLVVTVFGPQDERVPYVPVLSSKADAALSAQPCVSAEDAVAAVLLEDDAITGRNSGSETAANGPLIAMCREAECAHTSSIGFRNTLLAMRDAIRDVRERTPQEIATLARETGSAAKYSVYTWPAFREGRGHGLVTNAIISLAHERSRTIAKEQRITRGANPHVDRMRRLAHEMCFISSDDRQMSSHDLERTATSATNAPR